jgi:ABC-type branched-subunit amino acid transport system ATPase component
MVEQKVQEVLKISDRVIALKLGKVYTDSPATDLILNNDLLKKIFL